MSNVNTAAGCLQYNPKSENQALDPELHLTPVFADKLSMNLPAPLQSQTPAVESDQDEQESIVTTLSFLDLPDELILHILGYLDSEPPSQYNANARPDANLTCSMTQPLKQISQASKHLRRVALPILFRHLRLDPRYLTPFLAFVGQNNLAPFVTTVTAVVKEGETDVHPAWWALLLNSTRVTTLKIHTSPSAFMAILGVDVCDDHSWAFNMPWHTVTLSQHPKTTNQPISYQDLPSLFAARTWTELKYNEGSSLKAYATYEYFLKRTPSLLTAMNSVHFSDGHNLFSSLEFFSFVAIFPFYNHVDDILKCVRQMGRLKRLFVKLCPAPESEVLAEEICATNSHIDVNDPWNEFETALSLISHTVKYLTQEGALNRFEVDDVRVAGVRELVENTISDRLSENWLYQGSGVWSRQTSI